tara:strand:- start:10898 stop:11812 length:915 start_codon:yes stop_codon:yes gene_type:complete
MVCRQCKENPVIKLTNSNISLCKRCFTRYFERKVFKVIRDFELVKDVDKIGVAVSGGKDSLTVLKLLKDFSDERRGFEIVAIAIDEGIEGYRDVSLEKAREVCDSLKIELKVYSYEEEFGYPLDVILKKLDVKPCSVCGVFRRYLLNKAAKDLKVDRLATGHNLDDESQTILMNQFRDNPELSARLGPLTGIKDHDGFIKRIKPLYLVTEKEVMTYAFLKELVSGFNECPNAREGYRDDVRDLLNKMEEKYPGSKHALVRSFLQILPMFKNEFKDKSINVCGCGEPSSKEECRACYYKRRLNES